MARRQVLVDTQHVADSEVRVADFGGYMPNADPHDVRPGESIRQVNAMSWKPGELRVRPGYAVVSFEG